jgi:hypothetical protein
MLCPELSLKLSCDRFEFTCSEIRMASARLTRMDTNIRTLSAPQALAIAAAEGSSRGLTNASRLNSMAFMALRRANIAEILGLNHHDTDSGKQGRAGGGMGTPFPIPSIHIL